MPMQALPIRSALLVSDIHLSHDQPELAQAFFYWLAQHTVHAPTRPESLFILGDLVDAWVGDDQLTHAGDGTIEDILCRHLQSIRESGIVTYFLHGNRDFLIGPAFAKAAGVTLLSDPTLIEVTKSNQPFRIALTHGDQLCTQDTEYQNFRQQVREPQWQAAFLAKPLHDRLQIARDLRAQSEREKSGKSMAIMDITPEEAVALTDTLNVDALIHGHTHRPGHHQMRNGKTRWVLPDWEVDQAGALIRGGGLWVDSQGICSVSPHI